MIIGILSFLFGVLLLQQLTGLPDIYWCYALIFIVFLPFISHRYYRIFALFLFGFLYALFRAHWVLDVALPDNLQGKDVLVTGVVASIPIDDKRKRRFEFDIETLKYNKQLFPFEGKVRISWYGKKWKEKNARKIKLKAGQRWQLWLRLKQPHGFMNPGGFDYEGWLYQKKIRATGYVRINAKKNQFAKKLNDVASGYQTLIIRQKLYDHLRKVTANLQYSGILIALAMGDRTGISQQQWKVFRATGTSHLVAISGLHIGLLAGLVFLITRRLWPYFGSTALLLASPRAAAICALIAAIFYAALSGFAVPSQRALMMLGIVMLSIFWLHKVQSSQVLSLALLSVLLFDPVSVLSPGFWLSFAAVAIIGLAAFGRLSMDKNWKIWGRLQWRISIALIPLLIFLFQQASLVSPIANLLAIPLVSFIVVPLALFASSILLVAPDLASHIFTVADITLKILWWFLSYLENIPLGQWYGVKPDVLVLCVASLGFILLLTPKGWPIKVLGLFLILPLTAPNTHAPAHGEVEVTLLDVGQGLATVVQTANHSLVFDTGPQFSESFDTGSAVVLPFLRQKNIKVLDMLIVSHEDNDHSGGFKSVQRSIEIKQLLSSYNLEDSERCFYQQKWQWDGVYFEMLNPSRSRDYKKRNNASCMLRISTGEKSLLLSADIEKKTEKYLVNHHKHKLKSTYLVVPHHGSKTSSSQAFMDAVNPDYALIPVGFRNRYRMPHSSVIERYKKKNIPLFETYKLGAISVRFGEKSINLIPHGYRQDSQKYWNSKH